MTATSASGIVAVDIKATSVPLRDFDAVIEAHRPMVFRFALASLRDRDLAETTTQDCFFKAHRAWHLFRGEANV